MRILFTGGGTGGHIFPIIAVAREIRRIYPRENIKFFYLGPPNSLHSILLSQEDIKVGWVLSGKIRRYFSGLSLLQTFIDIIFKIPIGFWQSFFSIFFIVPDVIFSKGGYGSLPVVFSGWLFRIPIYLHEADVVPGVANRILSHFAKKIFTSFPQTQTEYFPPRKMIETGNPVRKEIAEGSKEKAQELFKMAGGKPVVLILGGSQGAERINDTILTILPELLQNFEVFHQGGEKKFKELKAEAQVMILEELKKYYHIFSFLREPELKQAYAAADIVVSRAGAGSIFEIAYLGKSAILIPLPESAQDHQVKNAYVLSRSGAAVVFEEENLTPHFLLEKLKYLISHPQEMAMMSQKARAFFKPDAARRIAEYILGSVNS